MSSSAIADYLLDQAAEQSGKAPASDDASRVDDNQPDQGIPAQDAQEVESVDNESQAAIEADNTDEQDDTVSLDDLAEMLDVPTKEIYSVNIPIGNGEHATLGQFKDAFKRMQKADAEQEQFETHRREQENQILVARRQTEDLVNMLIDGGKITPDDLAAVENINRARLVKENRSALAVMPHWKDPEQRQQDFDSFVQLGADYGFSDVEIRNISDHRILKMLFDFSAQKRHAANKRNGKNPPKQIGGGSKRPGKTSTLAQRKREARKLGGQVKTQLIADMITGKQSLE